MALENVDFSQVTEVLKRYLRETNDTIQNLAEEIGVNRVTLGQVARGDGNPSKATLQRIHDSIKKINNLKRNTPEYDKYKKILIGVGGSTVYSSNLLAAIYNDSLPQNVMICFGDKERDKDKRVPYEVNSSIDLEEYLEDSNSNFKNRYFAIDLRDLSREDKVDAVMMARETFEENFKLKSDQDLIMFCRMMVGYSVNLRIIKKISSLEQANLNENREDEIIINSLTVLENAKQKAKAVEKINTIIDQCENLRIGIIKNTFIRKIYEDLKSNELDKEVSIKCDDAKEEDLSYMIDNDCSNIRESILEEDLVYMIIGFEPTNHIIYEQIKGESEDIVYYNFNLSKILGKRNSYCLFVKKRILKDKKLFALLVDFVNSVNRVGGNERILDSNDIRNITKYFFPGKPSHNYIPIIEAALKQLRFNNVSLQFINFVYEESILFDQP